MRYLPANKFQIYKMLMVHDENQLSDCLIIKVIENQLSGITYQINLVNNSPRDYKLNDQEWYFLIEDNSATLRLNALIFIKEAASSIPFYINF